MKNRRKLPIYSAIEPMGLNTGETNTWLHSFLAAQQSSNGTDTSCPELIASKSFEDSELIWFSAKIKSNFLPSTSSYANPYCNNSQSKMKLKCLDSKSPSFQRIRLMQRRLEYPKQRRLCQIYMQIKRKYF